MTLRFAPCLWGVCRKPLVEAPENTFRPLRQQLWCDQRLQAAGEEAGLCPSCLLIQVRCCLLIKETY